MSTSGDKNKKTTTTVPVALREQRAYAMRRFGELGERVRDLRRSADLAVSSAKVKELYQRGALVEDPKSRIVEYPERDMRGWYVSVSVRHRLPEDAEKRYEEVASSKRKRIEGALKQMKRLEARVMLSDSHDLLTLLEQAEDLIDELEKEDV